MAKTVVALFERIEDARDAIDDLVRTGVSRDQISYLAQDTRDELERERGAAAMAGREAREGTKSLQGTGIGAGTGGVLGGIIGALIGAGTLVLAPLGPLVLAGPIVGALAGIGTGGALGAIVGALIGLGVPEDTCQYYAEGVRRGGHLVLAKVSDEMASAAEAALQRHNPVNVREQAAEWERTGWSSSETMRRM